MSFGWSAGDVVAGVKILWDIWESIRDGPLSAKYEATQFFNDFEVIKGCLESWYSRDPASPEKPNLTQPLLEQCALFIDDHVRLIQDANKGTKEARDGRRNWIRKVTFTKQQALTLCQQVQWSFERGKVTELRKSLEQALGVATFKAVERTHDAVESTQRTVENGHELLRILTIRVEGLHAKFDQRQTNYENPNSYPGLANSITVILSRILNPPESSQHVNEIDYLLLTQFEGELHTPEPLRIGTTNESPAQQSPSRRISLNGLSETQAENSWDPSFSRSTTFNENTQPWDDSLFGRLENLSKRLSPTADVSITPNEEINLIIDSLVNRLRALRRDFFGSVDLGVDSLNGRKLSQTNFDSKYALIQEREVWNRLKMQGSALEGNIKHNQPRQKTSPNSPIFPPPLRQGTWSSPYPFAGLATTHEGVPLDIQPDVSPQSSPYLSPYPFDHARSSVSSTSSLSSMGQRRNSTLSLPPVDLLDRAIPVVLDYHSQKRPISGTVKSIFSSKKGPRSVWICSNDEMNVLEHSLDPNPSDEIETSLKPFIENRHLASEDLPLEEIFRVQFMGRHKIISTDTSTEDQTPRLIQISRPPIYIFHNITDFQGLLLKKEVKCQVHIQRIDSLPSDIVPECRNSGSIHILLDLITQKRSIIYFRTRPDPKQAFVEWSVNIFKRPNQPKGDAISLKLEGLEEKAMLSLLQHRWQKSQQPIITRNSLTPNGGRTASILSFTSVASTSSNRSTSKGNTAPKHKEKMIVGLVINFLNPNGCQNFWRELDKGFN